MSPKISSAEWEVMNVVWDRSPLTAAEVFAALPADHGWKQKTVNTFLARLDEKGVLKVAKRDGVNVYAPRLRRGDCVAAESESFLQRVFQGAAGPLLLHFCEQQDLSAEEIEELQRLLRKKKGRP
ncbi:MAG TPA: BlaI/MecI/CopY family transcriptional regulator [Opitutaceae bacterium]|nr:BlaI/MecI/CopY family transcriptional regulator [Opitutaceae bacterium]HRJ46099.1 BlaI/MecI/CopY family transcriptional regulator [Opitutaceae bacterium]